jgi:uncharacterized membrane protein YdjX (TVP38/TMEM64 family)
MKLRGLGILRLGVLIGLVAGAWILSRSYRLEPNDLVAQIESYDPALTRLVYVALYILGTVFLLPGVILSFIGGLLFGVWEGTLYTWIGATIGATAAFFLARLLGREFVNQLLGGKFRSLDDRVRERGFVSVFLLRLVPLFPFNGVNFGCGLTSVRPRDYVLATALGIIPGTFVYQYLFANVGARVLREGISWHDLADFNLLMPVALFVAFLGLTTWLAVQKKRRASRRQSDMEGQESTSG